jgi:hypothetical protein
MVGAGSGQLNAMLLGEAASRAAANSALAIGST